VGTKAPQSERVDPIQNTGRTVLKKPKGGLWTSPTQMKKGDGITSAWIDWMQAERWCNVPNPKVWLLEPKEDIAVYTIDGPKDVTPLLEYPENSPVRVAIDFERMFNEEGYDAIHLTTRGQQATRFPDNHSKSLYGWDCESILWDDWHFEHVIFAGNVKIPEPEYC